ncbi:MAG: transketolase C-terminal domain-containing protein [Burkholderiaceae bacterium]
MENISYSQAAVRALEQAFVDDERVIALGEDVGRGGIFGQYMGLAERFGGNRVIDTPISEATIVGASVGMALTGLRPVVEMRVIDFALCAIDEIVNQAAKNRFMFGGQGRVPMVLRMPIGVWTASAAQHSQSLEAWFAHIPGLVVVAPATVEDNHRLLLASIASDDPVIYLEHKELWAQTADVALSASVTADELGKAKILREGSDLTIVSWSKAVHWSLAAARSLAESGISVEVIDLRTLWPWDREAVLASARRTGRLMVVHEAVQTAGYGAEIVATVAEAAGGDVRVARLGAPRLPVGYSPGLEALVRIDEARIVTRVRDWLGR